jgi:hypothetical protein
LSLECRYQCKVWFLHTEIYRVFHNVLCDYKYLKQENQRTYLSGIVHNHRKTVSLFLTTRDVWCVHHGWHGTHWYNIQVTATHMSASVHWYSSLLQSSVPLGTDHCSSAFRLGSLSKKNFFSFPIAVNNCIKVGPLFFLLQIFVITENIMKCPVYYFLPLIHSLYFKKLLFFAVPSVRRKYKHYGTL